MLKKLLQHKKIILASGSPRRQQFFKELDINFEIRLKEIEETYPEHLKGVEITDYLSKLKSDAFEDLDENDILITSDTIVWHENKALGKPKNEEDAFNMLDSLSNKTHQVLTSVCFKTYNSIDIINDTTNVTFKKLTAEEIKYYIATYKPFDKAGGYGIQEWIGLIGITKIEGSYSNVVGLPVQKVYQKLVSYV